MRMQWDSALVGATARALDRRFHGARIRAFHLDPVSRRLSLFLREATLIWELHPERTGLRITAAVEPPEEARRLPAKLVRVSAPLDDRVMILDTRRVRGRPARGSLVLELIPRRENAVFAEGEEATIRALLRTAEGDRPLRRGRPWRPPEPTSRAGAREPLAPNEWRELMQEAAKGPGGPIPYSRLAFSSPLARPLLEGADGYTRWLRLRSCAVGGGDPTPGAGAAGDPTADRSEDPGAARDPTADRSEDPGAVVIQGRFGPQPYPIPVPERTLEQVGDLIEAFRRAEALSDDQAVPATLPGSLLQLLSTQVDRARGRVARLEEELGCLDDPEQRQAWGDLLLARFHEVRPGMAEAVLEGFDGDPVRIPLDPSLTPDENARRHYDRAARIRRALERLPERIREARAEWERLEAIDRGARTGTTSREEIEAALPAGLGKAQDRGGREPERVPYRLYRSSGGLEIRVGRGAGHNDDLTFRHSSPDDIWLHARHTAGAHVILRWGQDGNPPERDLREAAVLAALHSKARTSGSVPVDWTRRKHVRKPRKAPPGAVLPQRVSTVFVTPNPEVDTRLREE